MKSCDGDGTEINPDLMPKPDLCITCDKDGVPGKEEILGATKPGRAKYFHFFPRNLAQSESRRRMNI
jgi:hypothetical protein